MSITAVALLVLLLVGCATDGDEDSGATTTTIAPALTTTSSSAASPESSATTTSTSADDLTGSQLTALLTPGDVRAVSELAEVGRAGRNPGRGLGGDLNFVTPDGQPVLMVVVQPAASFSSWKSDPDSYREDLDGLGEAAFLGPAPAMNDIPYLVVFRSGERTIGLLTYDDPDVPGWNNLLTVEQLQELARVIIGRL
ncbi:MAG: hypothetical protein ACYCX3_05845 [Thermoleophilia bacterium]